MAEQDRGIPPILAPEAGEADISTKAVIIFLVVTIVASRSTTHPFDPKDSGPLIRVNSHRMGFRVAPDSPSTWLTGAWFGG